MILSVEWNKDKTKALVTAKSPFSGNINQKELPDTPVNITRWANGCDDRLIQEVFPQMTNDEREFLLTGITQGEWDDLYEEDE